MSSSSNASNSKKTSAPRAPRATKDSGPLDPTLELARAVAEISKKGSHFKDAVDNCNTLIAERLADYELTIESKKRKLQELEVECEQEVKNQKINLDQSIREHGYKAALDVLACRNPREIAVIESEHALLKKRVGELEQDMESRLAVQVQKAVADIEKNFQHQTETNKLKHLNEIAALKAALESDRKHITVLENSLKDAKQELDAGRVLCRDIANAMGSAGGTNAKQPQPPAEYAQRR